MIHIDDISEDYDFDSDVQNKNIYTEYLQYLILKKIFNYDFGFEIYLAGDFYNRIKFKTPRFSHSLNLISETVNIAQRSQINGNILKSLTLEGYKVILQQNNSPTVIKIKTDNIPLWDDERKSKDNTPIIILINFLKTEDLLGKKPVSKTQSLNINRFDICTRINFINPELAMTMLTKKIIKTKKITSIELFDLYYFKNLGYSIDKKYFNKTIQGKIPGELYKLSLKVSKPKLIKELSACAINKSGIKIDDIINDKSWIRTINI